MVNNHWLVVWNMAFIFFSICWEFRHPKWRTPSFFRGVGIPPTSDVFVCVCFGIRVFLFRYSSCKEPFRICTCSTISHDLRGARHFGRKPSWWKTAGWDLATPDWLKMYRCSSILLLVSWNILEYECPERKKKKSLFHRIGLWENLQESPIFDGKNHGFL